VDSGSPRLGDDDVRSPDPDEERRVEELLRINARLAAEVRSLALGRVDASRPSSMTASRRLGALIEERDDLLERLQESETALETTRVGYRQLVRNRDELAAEVSRLRGGWRGYLRRARARLLPRR
jgi:hypothetical protein